MNKIFKNLIWISICCVFFTACKKDRYVFTMKYLKLNSYQKSSYPIQNLSIKVVNVTHGNTVLASTQSYSSSFILPATFAVYPNPAVHLYKEDIALQLWGDSTGLIASSTINMKEYKIIFPIDMETGNDQVSFSVMGSWE